MDRDQALDQILISDYPFHLMVQSEGRKIISSSLGLKNCSEKKIPDISWWSSQAGGLFSSFYSVSKAELKHHLQAVDCLKERRETEQYFVLLLSSELRRGLVREENRSRFRLYCCFSGSDCVMLREL